MSLEIVPITNKDAAIYVDRHHRHHHAPNKRLFSVAVAERTAAGLRLCGVAIVGHPVARRLDDGWSVEVLRVCTDGTRNAPSKLYGAAWRAARALGYRCAWTYTLPSEGGASLRGAGWRCLGTAGGGSWSRENRPRVDLHPTQRKIKWGKGERQATGAPSPDAPEQKPAPRLPLDGEP